VSAAAGGRAEAPAAVRESADWETVKGGAEVTVRGRVRLVGTALFSSLVISDAAGRDWYVAEGDRAKVREYEQREVTVRAVAERKPMTLADGKKLEDRRILRGISVLE
jgi:hypothetical protein